MVALKSGARCCRCAGAGCWVSPDGLLNIVITLDILTDFTSVCLRWADVPPIAIIHGFHRNPRVAGGRF